MYQRDIKFGIRMTDFDNSTTNICVFFYETILYCAFKILMVISNRSLFSVSRKPKICVS
jgi:hypothetical protein